MIDRKVLGNLTVIASLFTCFFFCIFINSDMMLKDKRKLPIKPTRSVTIDNPLVSKDAEYRITKKEADYWATRFSELEDKVSALEQEVSVQQKEIAKFKGGIKDIHDALIPKVEEIQNGDPFEIQPLCFDKEA